MRTRAEANRQRWAILGVAVAVLVLSFVLLKSAYYQLVLTQVLLWAVLSLAWNILCGYSGYFSFGHAGFWGLGAYTVALGMMYFDLSPWISIPFCALVGAAAGAIIGYPTFRLRGHPAGCHTGNRVWHAGFRAGADPRPLRRGRQPLGPGHRRGRARALGRGAQRRARRCIAWHSGRRVRRGDHRDYPARARGGL